MTTRLLHLESKDASGGVGTTGNGGARRDSNELEYELGEEGGEEPLERLPLPPGLSGDRFGLYEVQGTAKDWKGVKGENAVVAVHGPEEEWAPAMPNEGAAGGVFAVVVAGGTQHKVMVGDVMYTNRMKGEVNEEVELGEVLVVGAYDWTLFGRPLIRGAVVRALVEEQTSSGKVIVTKFKKRKGYLRRTGHRQPITRFRICDIAYEFPSKEHITEYHVPYDPNRPPMPNHLRFW